MIGIIGAGGLGKEVLCCLGETIGWDKLSSGIRFLEEADYFHEREVLGISVLPFENEVSEMSEVVIAFGDTAARIRLSQQIPSHVKIARVVHPNVTRTPHTAIGKGSIVLGNVLLSCDVRIGDFAVINPGTTISHDAVIGDFFSASPGVNISGNCKIGDRVFMGTNAALRNGIRIGDDVVIGMGSVVVKDILSPGTYLGNPAVLVT